MELPGTMSVEVARHRLMGFFFSSWNCNTEALTPDDIATYARDTILSLEPEAVHWRLPFEFLKGSKG
jgi:hypothetical protein